MNAFEAHPTIARLESGSKYIKTHSAIIKVGILIKKSEGDFQARTMCIYQLIQVIASQLIFEKVSQASRSFLFIYLLLEQQRI